MSDAERLAALRSQLESRLRDVDVQLADIRSARGGATADDEHDPEGSTLSADWSLLAGLRESALASLADVAAAYGRLGAGTYGACVRCGRPIAPARLHARPAAALCMACA